MSGIISARSERKRLDGSVFRPPGASALLYGFAGCFLLLSAPPALAAEPQGATAKIVGLGAAACSQFSSDIESDPLIRRDYLAWAQGFMSGILLGRPLGTDVGLDLNPETFGILDQLRFLEEHCARNPALNFSEAVEALYKRLRKEGGI